jgi:hypothetical protein
MTNLPRDVTDLYLAPVVLQVDARLAELSTLNDDDLDMKIAIESDEPNWSAGVRQEGVLRTVSHLVDMHGWALSWDPRGVRLSHGAHSLVLGVPATVQRYVDRNDRL